MAGFSPQKFNLSNINNGQRFENGQIPEEIAFNAPIEGSAYAIEIADEALTKADEALTKADQAINIVGDNILDKKLGPLVAYPIGSIYMSVNETSPAALFGGRWEKIKDKFLIGAGNLYALGTTGGSADAVVVAHNGHLCDETNALGTGTAKGKFLQMTSLSSYGNDARGWDVVMDTEALPASRIEGEDGTGKNMPPYLAVYMWKRIA